MIEHAEYRIGPQRPEMKRYRVFLDQLGQGIHQRVLVELLKVGAYPVDFVTFERALLPP